MSVVVGRWKKAEIDLLLESVVDCQKRGYSLTEACQRASQKLYRSAGSCYSKFMTYTRLMAEKSLKKNYPKETDNPFEDIQQESSPTIVLEANGETKTVSIPEGKKVIVTIEINYV